MKKEYIDGDRNIFNVIIRKSGFCRIYKNGELVGDVINEAEARQVIFQNTNDEKFITDDMLEDV